MARLTTGPDAGFETRVVARQDLWRRRGRGGDWDTVLCLALRMAVRAGFVHVSFRGLENARGQTRNLELGSVEALEMGWTLGALPLN
jgi:hypothetical protein